MSATVLTRPAAAELEHIHDRQPLMLRREAWSAWLDPAVGADGAAELPGAPAPDLVATPESGAVGSVANNDPSLVEEVPYEKETP